jgi:uncharacterized protein
MTDTPRKPCTAFRGHTLLAAGPLAEVAMAVKQALEQGMGEPVLTFDDATGRVIDLDLRGSEADITARLSPSQPSNASARGRGRPKLGVVAREVTLLPRHWEWLAAQPGGASVTLRRLVDDARRSGGDKQSRRLSQEAAYRFMSAQAGNLPGFEEAIRALFADDRGRFAQQVAGWPEDVRAYATRLAFGDAA